jgi:hypothetical protein
MPTENENLFLSDSTLETVDTAFYKFVDEQLNLFCTTADGWKKVPVIWAFAERVYQIKNNKEVRDKFGALITPLISIDRVSVNKDMNKKGFFQANLTPYNDRRMTAAVLRQDRTSKFANADTLKSKKQINFITSKNNKKKVYDFYSIPIPVYVTFEYKISILTSFQQQMNELVHPLLTRSGALNYFIISSENHRFECFIEPNFEQDNKTDIVDQERNYKTDITIKVLGHLIGDGANQERKQVEKKQNAVEIKIPKENIAIIQEEPKKQKEAPSLLRNAGTQQSSGLALKKTYTIGNGVDSVYVIGHGLNTRDMFITVRETSAPYSTIITSITYTDLNNISIDMGTVIGNNEYTVTVIG